MGMLSRRKKEEIKAPAEMIEKVVKEEVEVKAPIVKEEKEVEETTEETVEETTEEEQEEEEKDWHIRSITTETQPVIYNSKTDQQLNIMEALAEILNRTQ